MCGIIGRISMDPDPTRTLDGLKDLEYRGYDSYGVVLFNPAYGGEKLVRNVSVIDADTIKSLEGICSNIELGHTRWATHGGITETNAHPQFDTGRRFYVVMNGIVENHQDIRDELQEAGYVFSSETDTEVIPMLYAFYHQKTGDVKKDLLNTTYQVLQRLKGEFSFLVKYQDAVVASKNINPLVVGFGENEVFLSSDINVAQKHTDKYLVLEDGDVFYARVNGCVEHQLLSEGMREITRPCHECTYSIDDDLKDTKFFMKKEIREQKGLRRFLTEDNLGEIRRIADGLGDKPTYLLGAGTSWHAALFMHYTLLKEGMTSQVILASELNNYLKVMKGSNAIVFSQSGETADLIFPLKKIREENNIIAVTNTPNSTLDRIAQHSIYLNCGREVAVASTKAFTAQMMTSMALGAALKGDTLNIRNYESMFDDVLESNSTELDRVCERFSDVRELFFLGRDQYYPLAMEGALKLKEISYIHAEGFAGGELKHGTLALIEDGVPAVVMGSGNDIISNATEVKTRGGVIVGISDKPNRVYDHYMKVPEDFSEIFSVVLTQELALRMALLHGYNPDKPRNLAKSVTVK